MTDDFTVLRLDIDSAAMRALLEAIPGVEPGDFDETDDDQARGTVTERTSAPSTSRSGPRVGETPPPGAGDQLREPDEADGEGDEGGRRRTLLLAGVGTTVFAVLAGVAALLYRRRSTDGDEVSVLDVGGLLDGDEQASTTPEGTGDDDRISADERAASTVDAAPFVGMGALAVSAVVARYVQSDERASDQAD
jgi:hypothetical protein